MAKKHTSAWNVSLREFEDDETRSSRLEFLVRYAVLAPSTHNSQPWQFRVRSGALELLADRSRSLEIADPHDRELTISCGAALQFARLAARNVGREGSVEILPPSPDEPDLLARLRLGAGSSPTPGEVRRFSAIEKRHTNRTAMTSDPRVAETIRSLAPLAHQYGIGFLASCDAGARAAIADLVAEADRGLMANPEFRRELAYWIRPARSSTHDGMSVGSFGMSDQLSGAVSYAVRALNLGHATADRHHDLILNAPAIAMLTSLDDDPRAWLHTGMALADILLELTARGLACSFANQPMEVETLRPRTGELLHIGGHPQMLMRIGVADEVAAAPRRDAAEVASA